MIEKTVNNDKSDIDKKEDYLKRPRLDMLLKKAMDYSLIIICAGSGYGKTRAVHSFLSKCDAIAPWM